MATPSRPVFTQRTPASECLATAAAVTAHSTIAPPPHRSNFLPATGTLKHLRAPEQTACVRVDTGVRMGDTVSIFYDPMIAKLIVWGERRADALHAMSTALREYQVVGLPNNLDFLTNTLTHPAFAQGGVDTSFLTHHLQECLPSPTHTPHAMVALAAVAHTLRSQQHRAAPAATTVEGEYSTDHRRDIVSPVHSLSAHLAHPQLLLPRWMLTRPGPAARWLGLASLPHPAPSLPSWMRTRLCLLLRALPAAMRPRWPWPMTLRHQLPRGAARAARRPVPTIVTRWR